jgi:hypothetical protein
MKNYIKDKVQRQAVKMALKEIIKMVDDEKQKPIESVYFDLFRTGIRINLDGLRQNSLELIKSMLERQVKKI